MIAVDSSIAIAAFGPWHQFHTEARDVLGGAPHIVAHAAIETYSVLTRLPAPHRAPADVVADYLRRRFGGNVIAISPDRYASLPTELAKLQITGGSTYDALIGITADEHAATLVSCDRRARSTYDAVGVATRLIS